MNNQELLDFLYTRSNIGNCRNCPYNRGEDGHESNGNPCGQQNCWVRIHCDQPGLNDDEDNYDDEDYYDDEEYYDEDEGEYWDNIF